MPKEMNNNQRDYLTVRELADLLHISRVAVFNKIKKGQLRAHKAGHTYIIPKDQLSGLFDHDLSGDEKEQIKKGVRKAIHDYGETLKLLGKE